MFYVSFTNVKRAALLVFLLTQTMLVQAENTDVTNTMPEVAVGSGSDDQQQDYQRLEHRFPRWPQRQQVSREVIPLAPPGPYMSSALSDFPVETRFFGQGINKPGLNQHVANFDSSKAAVQTFSPDIPWPVNLRSDTHRSAERWMPENGYQFVKPQLKKKLYPAVPYSSPLIGITHARPSSYVQNYAPAYSNPAYDSAVPSANTANRAPYPSSGRP